MVKIPFMPTYKFYLLTIIYAQNNSLSTDYKLG